jgi:glycosyltransferase involved in cell wall biosynthesis
MKILYVGNFLTKQGRTPSPNELICEILSKKFVVKKCSSFTSKTLRFFHMIFSTITASAIRKHTVIVDVFSSNAFWFAFFVTEVSNLFKLPTILVLHGGNLPIRFKKSNFASSRMLRRASAVVSPSSYLKYHVKQIFKLEIEVIPNPIKSSIYPYIPKQFKYPCLLWVRSFHEIYNPLMAVELCNLLKDKYPNIELTMIGPDKDGSLKKVTERALELELSKQIYTFGLMSKEDWIKKSIRCNIFINTTHIDNTPVSVIEALALGIPVVSTNVGGVPFLLENERNAVLVNDEDVFSMCLAVEKILNNEVYRNMLIQNGKTLVEQMDLDIVEKKWLNLIEKNV